jgi:hypothetical protein
MAKKGNSSLVPWILVMLVMFPVSFFLGVEKEGKLSLHVDITNLTGIRLWIVNLYNDERLLFAILVTVTMAVIGMSIALIADVILKLLGLEVTKIEHHE